MARSATVTQASARSTRPSDAALALASRLRAVRDGPAPEIPRLRQVLADAPRP